MASCTCELVEPFQLPSELRKNNGAHGFKALVAPKFRCAKISTTVKDLGIKLADPSKLLLPRYKLGSKSCVLIVDINKENPVAKSLLEAGAVDCGEVIVGVGADGLVHESGTTWFDLRPLEFTQAYCVIRTIVQGSDTFYFVLQRNAFPVGVGCEVPVPPKVELKRPSSAQQRTEAPKKTKPETKRSERKLLVWDKRSFTKVYTIAKEKDQKPLGIVLSEARTKDVPVWLPPPFKSPVMNFPFVSAVYDISCFKHKVKPGDALLEINGKSLSRVGIGATVQRLTRLNDESATFTFGRPADMQRYTQRFERLYLQGKGGVCLVGSTLPRLMEENKTFTTSTKPAGDSAFTPSRQDHMHSVVKKRQRQTQSARSLVRSLDLPDSGNKSAKTIPNIRTPSYSESTIRVGPEYQAEVGEFKDIGEPESEQDWDRSMITRENVEQTRKYVDEAQSQYQVSIDIAMRMLHKLEYKFDDAKTALIGLSSSRKLPGPTFIGSGFSLDRSKTEWSKQDLNAFTLGMYRVYKRDFSGVQKFMRGMGCSKSRKEIVDFYYGTWKLSRAYGDWRVYAKSLVGCATEFHNDVCSGCKEEKDEDVICCDTCNLVFHLECVDPPLLQIPNDDWSCPQCENVFTKLKNCDAVVAAVKDYISTQNVSY